MTTSDKKWNQTGTPVTLPLGKHITEDGEVIDTPIYKTFETFFKTPYNHDTRAESRRVAQTNTEPSKTQQHQAHEADINTIVKNFGITGKLPVVAMPPVYEEFSEIFDFQSAMNAIKAAQDSFIALPANIRARFENDPAKFVGYVDYCINNGDIDPLREMGLAIPAAAQEPKSGTPPSGEGTPDKEPSEGSKT